MKIIKNLTFAALAAAALAATLQFQTSITRAGDQGQRGDDHGQRGDDNERGDQTSITRAAPNYSDWSAPVNLGPVINSVDRDIQPAISKNGLSLYFTSNRPGGFGFFDIYVSQRASVNDPWGAPVNLGPTINSADDEGAPVFSRDGHFMFFQGNYPGGLGDVDIWVSWRQHTHDDFGWQPPVNLGAGVNSAALDAGPSYFENDEGGAPQLYFGSTRLGSVDIYLSELMADGSFGPAMLVPELSSPSGESRPSIRHDGLEIFFESDRPGSFGSRDLWVATRDSTLDAWSTPVNLGATLNTTSDDRFPYLSPDGETLFFVSNRPGGFGGLDLYMSTRTKLRGRGDRDLSGFRRWSYPHGRYPEKERRRYFP